MTNNFTQNIASAPVTLDSWREGWLDIHFIDTGRGNAMFCIFPDSTTLLVDAGDMSDTHPRVASPRTAARRPDSSRSAPQWIAAYIRRFGPDGASTVLDYALVTHWHDDHIGEIDEFSRLAANGAYKLTGIIEVGDSIPVRKLLDRGFEVSICGQPSRNILDADFQRDYIALRGDECNIIGTINEYARFIDYHKQHNGMVHEVFTAGSNRQIRLLHNPAAWPLFEVRNIAGSGQLWTGENETCVKMTGHRDENNLSAIFKLTYGSFKFCCGGDISGMDDFGSADLNSVEAQVAPLAGKVDVAVLNHHGNRNSCNPYFVRTLRPQVWIGQSWSSDHPGEDTFHRLMSRQLYPNTRDIFATATLEPIKSVIGEALDDAYRAQNGHIVVRVYENTEDYSVYVLDSSCENCPPVSRFNYRTR